MADILTAPELRSALHSFDLAANARSIDDSAGVWANEILGQGYVVLRGRMSDGAFSEASKKTLGIALPVDPCTVTSAGQLRVLWISPNEWVIVAPRERCQKLAAELAGALKGIKSQVVDNSGGYTEVSLLGREARTVLSHCTVYNLDGLKPDRIVGTTFGKMSCYLMQYGKGYRLIFRRSFADYIWRYLVRAASPYGFAIGRLPLEKAAET